MKKRLLIVLLPVVLMIAGALGVWANEQAAVNPGCNNCVKAEEAAPAKVEPGCANCAKMKAAVAPEAGAAGCDKCAKVQPAQQPVKKGCCDKGNAKPQ